MEARINQLTQEYAVLKLADQQELKWPIKMLPSNLKTGMRVWLKLETFPPPEKEKSFKDFLNEVLEEHRTDSREVH